MKDVHSGTNRPGRGVGRGSGHQRQDKYERRAIDEQNFVLKLYKAKFGVRISLQASRRTCAAGLDHGRDTLQVNNTGLSAERLHDQLQHLFKATLWHDDQLMSTKQKLNSAKTRIDDMDLECVHFVTFKA